MPNKPVNIKALFAAYQKKVSFIDSYNTTYSRELRQLQRELAMQIVADFIPQLHTKDGYIILDAHNSKALAALDALFVDFKNTFATNVFKGTAEAMLNLTALSSDYFRVMNYSTKTLGNIMNKLDKMRFTIGLNNDGSVVRGSFIDNLASTPQTKSLLSDFVRKGVEGEMPYNDFVKGFRELIEGNADIDGALVRYSEGYVHDSMFAHSAAVDKFIADELGLECFYYAGDLIDTSRQWCIDHVGKIYTYDEIESWADKDWDGKIPGEDPFIQRGGYRCRHNFMPVPCDSVSEEEMANEDPGIE